MGKPKVAVNSKQVRRWLRSPEALANLVGRGGVIASTAGPGFEVKPSVGRNRARVAVVAVTPAAKRAEARDGVLTRALEAGRG